MAKKKAGGKPPRDVEGVPTNERGFNADVEEFGDEQEIRDPFRGREIRFTTKDDVEKGQIASKPGDKVQGILLGAFSHPSEKYKDQKTGEPTVSIGYQFLDTAGQKMTVWGSVAMDRAMQEFEPPVFVTIEFLGTKGKNNVKTFKVTASEKGLQKYKHLLRDVDMDEYKWDIF